MILNDAHHVLDMWSHTHDSGMVLRFKHDHLLCLLGLLACVSFFVLGINRLLHLLEALHSLGRLIFLLLDQELLRFS